MINRTSALAIFTACLLMASPVGSAEPERLRVEAANTSAPVQMNYLLYLPPGSGLPVRVHGAFVDDDEVHRVVSAWKARGEPEYVDDGLARFRYQFPDDSVFHLNMFPLRLNYIKRLMKEVGFQKIETYGDFLETQEPHDVHAPDYYIHIAEKKYIPKQ